MNRLSKESVYTVNPEIKNYDKNFINKYKAKYNIDFVDIIKFFDVPKTVEMFSRELVKEV